MVTARKGDTVFTHYQMSLENGDIVDSTQGRSTPLCFKVGEGKVIHGLEVAVEGMSLGDSRQYILTPEEAFGKWIPSLVRLVPIDQLPKGITPVIDQHITLKTKSGGDATGTITAIQGNLIKIDFNHHLAGHNIYLDIVLIGVNDHKVAMSAPPPQG